ncbi:CrcB family protein [Nocardioides sp. SOB77]|uniref:Fluoride-specific ion channel FluC n=1 Tax=Nocardioides oceani TaxID=3058369 RepID=A0ABT8FIV4_9ACTN|nr:CrcB family protein [Nocardioides oceani]MDN4174459.1 CrcB family protein [Nocardioides oceani]
MTGVTVLLVAVGGALGSALRYVAASVLDARWPRGTLAVNLAGSALLGLLVARGPGDAAYALVGVGFCGGLTTWSAFAVQTHRLGPRPGAAYAVATLGLALAACALGFWVGAQA